MFPEHEFSISDMHPLLCGSLVCLFLLTYSNFPLHSEKSGFHHGKYLLSHSIPIEIHRYFGAAPVFLQETLLSAE